MKKTPLIIGFLLLFFTTYAHEPRANYHFSQNKGQLPENVLFHCNLHLGDVFLEKDRFTFDLFSAEELNDFYHFKHNKKARKSGKTFDQPFHKHAYSMVFENANPNPTLSSRDKIEGIKNYYKGNDPSQWASGVESFRLVQYENLYNFIDLEIYAVFSNMKYDFIVHPGGDPNQISIKYEGVDELELVDGALISHLSNGSVKELKPISYQVIDGKREYIKTKFIVSGNKVTFEFPDGYDPNVELTIDPTWEFSTLTGSASDNWGFTATYDTLGNLYSGGIAFGTGYPTVAGSYQTTFAGGDIDIGITKYSSDGTTLIYSTYIGGSANEVPHSLVNDSQNNLVIMGTSSSSNYPTTGGTYDATFNGGFAGTSFNGISYANGCDIVITKLNSNGTALLGSTYVGGSDNDGLNESIVYNYSDEVRGEVVLGPNDEVYIATSTWSTDFPATAGSYSQSNFGTQDAVICGLSNDLTNLNWATYLGGSDRDAGYSIRVSPVNGNIYLCGGTMSTNLATTPGVMGTGYYGGSADGFLASLNSTNGALIDLSYVGSNNYDQAFIMEIDEFGQIFIVGQSLGTYPVFNAPYSNPNSSQFIHKMDPGFSTTDYSTVFGTGNNTSIDISLTAFLVDNCGNLYVSGWGGATNNEGSTTGLPITGDAQQSSTDGSDFYFFVMERNAQGLLYGSFFGSNTAAEHVDGGTSRFDKAGTVYQAVCAGCGGNSFPTTAGVWSNTNGSTNCNMGSIKFGFDFQGIEAQAIDPGDITLCSAVYTVDFDGGSTPPPYQFWDFGDGTGSSTATNPSYTYADTGFYQVMYVAIDSSTCNIADTVYFDVNLMQAEQFNAQFNLPVIDPCTSPDSVLVQLSFTGTGADSIVWDMGNGTIFADTSLVDYYYTSQGSYEITMTAWDFICNNTGSVSDSLHFITSYSAATAIPPNDTTLCSPPPFNYSFDAGANPPPHVFWDFGDGAGTSTSLTPTYTYADTGTYNVMYVAIDSSTCNIADTVYFTVDMNQAAQFSAQFNLPTPEPCTSPDSMVVNLSFTGTGADSIFWDMGDGSTFINDTVVDYYYTGQGSYIVSMTAWDFVCNNTASFSDTVNFITTYSQAQATVPPDVFLCDPPFNVDVTAGATPPPDNYWDFGDGTGTATAPDVTYTYADTGTYTVMYVAIDSSTCNIADTVYFTVTLEQAQQFSAVLDFVPPPPCGSDSMLVEMAFTGTGADSLIWDMGNGDVFNSDSVVYYYTEPGEYTVSMTAYDLICNHVETISETVMFSGNIITEVIIPNVFTPNGDGNNDELSFVNIDGSEVFGLTIWNRWGNKVFETDTATEFWDGTNRGGKNVPEGVYYFEIRYTDICSDEENITTGFVHLMR